MLQSDFPESVVAIRWKQRSFRVVGIDRVKRDEQRLLPAKKKRKEKRRHFKKKPKDKTKLDLLHYFSRRTLHKIDGGLLPGGGFYSWDVTTRTRTYHR